jgi:WD40 repeat protein
VQTIQQHEAPITAIAFAPDGSYIASGDESGKVIVWLLTGQVAGSGQQGGVMVTFRQDLGSSAQGEMRHVAYSNDGLLIATGSEGAVILWDGRGLVDRHVMDIGAAARAPDVAFSPDGSVLVATVDDDILAWSTSSGEGLEDLKGHKGYPINLAFSPDGKYLVSSGEDHTVITWDTATREQVGSFEAPESITAMAHAPDDSAIALGLANGDIIVVHTNGPDDPITLEGHTQQIEGLAYSPDSQLIASASSDGTVKLWHAGGGEIGVLSGDGSILFGVAFSPDGKLLAGTSEQGNLFLWSIPDGTLVAQVKASEGSIYDLAFSPDGKTLVLAPAKGIATVWEVKR